VLLFSATWQSSTVFNDFNDAKTVRWKEYQLGSHIVRALIATERVERSSERSHLLNHMPMNVSLKVLNV
jgi:hypothetical protein